GRSFFGAEGFLPAFVDLAPLASYLPGDAIVVVEDPAAVTRAVRDELGRAMSDEGGKQRAPHFKVAAFYESEGALVDWLGGRTAVLLHTTGIEGEAVGEGLERFEVAPPETPSLGARDQADLERAIKAARASHGKTGALDPLI